MKLSDRAQQPDFVDRLTVNFVLGVRQNQSAATKN